MVGITVWELVGHASCCMFLEFIPHLCVANNVLVENLLDLVQDMEQTIPIPTPFNTFSCNSSLVSQIELFKTLAFILFLFDFLTIQLEQMVSHKKKGSKENKVTKATTRLMCCF